MSHIDPYHLALAIEAELLSMMAFARLQRWLLHSGGVGIGLWSMAEVTFAGNTLGTTLPAAWRGGRRGRSPSSDAEGPRALAVWALLTAGALSGFALFLVIVAGAFVAGPRGPLSTLRPLAGGLAAVPLAAALLSVAVNHSASLRRASRRGWQAVRSARYPGRLAVTGLERLWKGIRTVAPSPAGWAEAAFFALANWLRGGGARPAREQARS